MTLADITVFSISWVSKRIRLWWNNGWLIERIGPSEDAIVTLSDDLLKGSELKYLTNGHFTSFLPFGVWERRRLLEGVRIA